MRTGNIDVHHLLAQAQARLAGSAQQASAGDASADTKTIGKLAPALAGVHERIAVQAHAASASLSVLGRFKADLFDLGTAARALSSLSAATPSKAVQAALDKLVAAYNAALKTGAAAGAPGAGTARAQRELGMSAEVLAAWGVVRQPDGSLRQDAGTLDKALAGDAAGAVAALAAVAAHMAGTTAEALAQDSRLSTSMSRLDGQAQALKAQQAAVMDTATRIAALNGPGRQWNAMALAAYRNA